MLSVVRLLSFSFLAASLITHSSASAATQTVFGPKNYAPGLLKPTDVTEQFASTAITGTIKIVNGDGKDIVIPVCSGNMVKKLLCEVANLITKAEVALTRPTSFSIELNNQVVVSQSNLPALKGSIELPITLKSANKVRIRVAGSFLSKIKVEIAAPVGTVNQLPIASMQLSHGQGFAPLTVTANGVASTDPDGSIVDFAWDFGDGGTSSGVVVTHIFTTPGSYSVRLTVKDNNGATNSQTKQVVVVQNQIPTADLRLASSGTGLAPLMVILDGSRSKDPENGLLRYFWNFGDGSTQIEGRPSETHEFVNAGSYTVVLIVRDENGGQAQSSVSVQVNAPVLPPAPETRAPPIADIAYPTFKDKVSFLYTGENPIQTGVNVQAIDPKRLSVIRGKVMDGEGQPLSGVTVKLLNEKDFGQTLSREDGTFDLAFNSGEFVNVEYSRNGFALAQRKLDVKSQNYFNVEDVHLVRLDPKVTTVSFGSSAAQIAKGTTQVDGSGERTGTVVIPAQTQATLILADGSTKLVPELNIRVTEFTVGENGPKRMPASLPPQSGYTYAVEVSADEAVALGAKSIKFSKPVSYYVDNFLNIPIGIAVPIGAYNPAKGAWVPERDGITIKIIGRDSNGLAQVDIGSGAAATATELAALNFDNAELMLLASNYPDGKSLWRCTIDHFTAIDLNYAIFTPENNLENRSDINISKIDNKLIQQPKCPGCEISVASSSMKEFLDIAGTDFKLTYSSQMVDGNKTESMVGGVLTGKAVATTLSKVEVNVNVAGQVFAKTYLGNPDLSFNYVWNGLDGYGRAVPDGATAKVKVTYKFRGSYSLNRYLTGRSSFGSTAGTIGMISESLEETSFTKDFEIPLKSSRYAAGLGKKVANGWFVSPHHAYDVKDNILYYGNGDSLALSSLPFVYQGIVGTGVAGFSGDGGPAKSAKLNSPSGVVRTSDGSLLIVDRGNNRIRKVDPKGIIDTVAGNGMSGYAGENGPATDAILNAPTSVRVNRNGSFYIVDTGNHCIRYVDEFGTISRFAGVCGQPGFTEGAQLVALLREPKDLVIGGDGSIYISDSGNHSIRKIRPDGMLTTLAGTGSPGPIVDEVRIGEAQFRDPRINDLDVTGNLYVADSGNNAIRRISTDGYVKNKVGPGGPNAAYFLTGDQYRLKNPRFAVVKASGEIFFNDDEMHTLSYFDLNGWVNPLLGYRVYNDPEDASYSTGTTAKFIDLAGMYLDVDGTKLFVDSGAHTVSSFGAVKPNIVGSTINLPSVDGSEVFIFGLDGKHLRTLYGKTGTTKYSFEYDSADNLAAIVDAFANRTSFSRAGTSLTQITSPLGQVSTISTDENGYLRSLTSPAGEVTEMAYSNLGLLTSFRKPKGNTYTYVYNNVGELLQENDPASGFQTVNKTPTGTIQFQTSSGVYFSVDQQSDEDGFEMTTYYGNRRQKYETIYAGSNSNSDTDGTYDESTLQYDPRSRGVTNFVGYSYISSFSGIADIQKVFRAYQFNSSNYFDYNLEEKFVNGYDSRVTLRNYTSQNKTEIITSPESRTKKIVLDEYERPISLRIGNLEPVLSEYDGHGRLIEIKAGERSKKFSYDSLGRMSGITDAIGRQFSFGFDSSNRMISQTTPGGEITNFAYDLNANLIGIKPPERSWHEFIFSLIDQISIYRPPENTNKNEMKYLIEGPGLLKELVRADGSLLNYYYDYGSRKPASIISGDSKEYILTNYELGGSKLDSKLSSDGVDLHFLHDAMLTTSKTYSGPVVASLKYEYAGGANGTSGAAFQISNEILGNSSFARSYDSDRELVSIGSFEALRNGNSQITNTSIGQISESFTYNKFGEMIQKRVMSGGSELFLETYGRDNLARVTNKKSVTQGVLTSYDYSYDLSGRLVSVNDGSRHITYSYDAQGNRIGNNEVYDSEDRLVRSGDFIYSYTPDGYVLGKTNSVSNEITGYTFDIFGSLKKVNLPDGREIKYLTDGERSRVVRMVNGVVTNKFVRNLQGQLVGELDSSNQVKSHFFYLVDTHSPDGMRKNGVYYKFIKDQLGSVRMVVNASSGEIVQMLEYDEFGVILNDTNPGFQPFAFVGGLYDPDTKLTRFGARDYDASIGRWIAKDPMKFSGGDTNVYSYVGNDPINSIDPKGLWSISIGGFFGYGFGITIGRNPGDDGRFFGSLRLGLGLGGGISFDKHGKSPDGGVCGGISIGQYAEASAHFGVLEAIVSTSSGFSQAKGYYYNDLQWAGGLVPTIGVGAGANGGIEVTFQ